jgi:hypothetical protein
MTNRPSVSVAFACSVLSLAACGETSGAVLERIPEHQEVDAGNSSRPPGTPLRADVFVVRNAASVAIGDPCPRNNDPDLRDDDCFEFEFDDGNRIGFRTDTLEFVAPDDDRIQQAEQWVPFDLVVADEDYEAIRRNFEELSTILYQRSNNEIFLDVKIHSIDTAKTGFVRFQNERGIFLPASALEPSAHLVNRDTDFVMAVTGARDPEQRLTPKVQHCAGTVNDLEDGFAGAGYTWLTTECDYENSLIRHWLLQVTVALPQANDFNDAYMGYYPTCGNFDEDPLDWWPSPDECSVDPDAPRCGDNRCEGSDPDYIEHLLTAHWPRRSNFVGNHCDNGEQDFDETDVDVGGACAVFGR